jgi:CRP-like cAMP-binding protein
MARSRSKYPYCRSCSDVNVISKFLYEKKNPSPEKMFRGDKYEFFSRTKFAGCLTKSELDELFNTCCAWINLQAGDVLFQRGDTCESGLYMVVDGVVGVYFSSSQMNYTMTAGDSIGDLDLLDSCNRRRRTAGVRAESQSLIMHIRQDSWIEYCSRNPAALLRYLRLSIGRLHKTSSYVLSQFLLLPTEENQLDVVILEGEVWRDTLARIGAALPLAASSVAAGCSFQLATQPRKLAVMLTGSVCVKAESLHSDGSVAASVSRKFKAPCILGARAFLAEHCKAEHCTYALGADARILSVGGTDDLKALAAAEPALYVDLMLAASTALMPSIDRFIDAGLNRSWVPAGRCVFPQGERADGLYVIISGRVKLFVDSDGPDRPARLLAEAASGDSIGDEAILAADGAAGGGPARPCTAYCVRDCELVKVSPQDFQRLFHSFPEAMLRFVRSLYQRSARPPPLAAAPPFPPAGPPPRALPAVPSRVAIVPLNPESEPAVRRFARQLEAALADAHGPVAFLDAAAVDGRLGLDGVADAPSFFYRTHVLSWIAREEESHPRVLLLADARASMWGKVRAHSPPTHTPLPTQGNSHGLA